MSYNLMLEGRLDYDEWSAISVRFPSLEIFPIPSGEDGGADALGVAVSLGAVRSAAQSVAEELQLLHEEAARVGLRGWDLVQGKELISDDDWQSTIREICG